MSGFDIGGIFAKLEIDSSSYDKTLDSAGGKAEGLKGKLGSVGKGIALGAGIGAFNLLSDAVGTAIGKLDEAHEAFLADQADQAAMEGALRRNVPAWDGNVAAIDAYIQKQMARGITDDDARDSLALLVGVTHDVAEAQNLENMALDLARAKNIDVETATKALIKAHDGNGAALKKLGVDVAGATTAADLYAAVQRNAGGAADAWAQTNQGKLAISNIAVGESMEKVGAIVDQASQVLIPALASAFVQLVDVLGQVWDASQPLREALAPALKVVFDGIGKFVGKVISDVQFVVRTIQNIIKLAQDAVDAVSKIPGVGLASDVAGNAAGAAGNVLGAIGGLVPHFASGTPGRSVAGLAMFGEQGPEIGGLAAGAGVLSASQTRAALDALGSGQVVNMGGVTLNVSGVNDQDAIARQTLQALRRELTRQGMSLA